MEKPIDLQHENKAVGSVIEDVPPKIEQAQIAAEEEHNLSVWGALTRNKKVVFWCIFFAFSAIGWCADLIPLTFVRLTDF